MHLKVKAAEDQNRGAAAMKRKTLCLKKAAAFILAAAFVILLGIPNNASGIWNRVFSFLGLGDFATYADKYPMSMHVLDVGKADSIFVECEGKYMLVDGGKPDNGEDVAAYLKRRGVSKLKYVFNSHPDADHIGGLKYVIDSFTVEHYFAPDIPKDIIPADAAYLNTQAALKSKNIAAIVPKPGDTYCMGSLKINVLGPLKKGATTNNNSIVLKLTYGNISFLLMGDAEKDEEDTLIESGENISADVLKVGHHGSNTSTTQKFLDAVQPKYAAISVGYDRNKLPKKEVLERLRSKGIPVYRTDVSGTLIFMTDGKTIKVKTEK